MLRLDDQSGRSRELSLQETEKFPLATKEVRFEASQRECRGRTHVRLRARWISERSDGYLRPCRQRQWRFPCSPPNINLSDMATCDKAFRREIIQSIPLEEKRFGFEPEISVNRQAEAPHVRSGHQLLGTYMSRAQENPMKRWSAFSLVSGEVARVPQEDGLPNSVRVLARRAAIGRSGAHVVAVNQSVVSVSE